MNIVLPMAGRGQRFVDAGYTLPKPLIDVAGRPMYSWALDSLPLALASRLVVVCLAEHIERYGLGDDIASRYPHLDPVVIPLHETTQGQACTVLAASPHLDPDEPLIIYNADTWCRTDLDERLRALPAEVAGLIGVFKAPGDHWSFARTDGPTRVVEVAEKRRISEWATTGLYHFSRAATFLDHATAMVDEDDRVNGEFYVAPVYNRAIAASLEIHIDVALEVAVLGTPPELEAFLATRAPHAG